MLSDLPQGAPQLQKANGGPFVATGYIDPCIVYLEATEEGEVPVLMACWAKSSQEVRAIGGTHSIKLTQVRVLTGRPVRSYRGWSMRDGQTPWSFFTSHVLPEVVLSRDDSGWRLQGLPCQSSFQKQQPYGFQGSLRYISAEADASLNKIELADAEVVRRNSLAHRSSRLFLAQTMLSLANVEWPSLVNALAYCRTAQRQPKPRRRTGPSLWRRVVSTVLGKKLAGV